MTQSDLFFSNSRISTRNDLGFMQIESCPSQEDNGEKIPQVLGKVAAKTHCRNQASVLVPGRSFAIFHQILGKIDSNVKAGWGGVLLGAVPGGGRGGGVVGGGFLVWGGWGFWGWGGGGAGG